MTETQKLLFRGLEAFRVPKGLAAEVFVRLPEEEKQVQMMDFMVSHETATPETLLAETRRISGE